MNVREEVLRLTAEGMAQSDIARELSISRQRVNQILKPLKHVARYKLNYAIKKTKITKPSKCSNCQEYLNLEAHHHDYNKPLDVIWLCKACHTKTHNPNAKPRKTHIPYSKLLNSV